MAVFGANDALVPVEASVTVYLEAVQPELLTLAVFPMPQPTKPGGDERGAAGSTAGWPCPGMTQ